jgi:anti-sigma regulatory factor (Ser/Thr protein kinase)
VKLSLSVPSTPEMLSSVRHTVLDWLAGAGFGGEGAHDVLVVVSELVTNGVIHDAGEDIELHLTKDAKGISIEVVTIGKRSIGEVLQFRGVTGISESGRGLIVVDALTDVLSIEDNHGRHHVICHVAIEHQADISPGSLGLRRFTGKKPYWRIALPEKLLSGVERLG